MKVLLTGASGFIGSHLLKMLIKKLGVDSVIALTSSKIPNVNCVLYDSVKSFGLDENQFDDITHVIHAGAFTPKNASQANDIKSCSSNIDFTTEFFSFSYSGLKRVINLSTLDVYAVADTISETSKVDPISLYGYSKLYCEQILKGYSKRKELDFLNLRIGHVYGPGEEKYNKVLPVAIKNIMEDKSPELWGDGSDLRSFIFIQDVVQAIFNALESPVKDMDINIVSGVSISIRELIEKTIKVSGKVMEVRQIESNHMKRDLVFDNSLLLSTLLERETDLLKGLQIEYEYMKGKYEAGI